MSATLHVDLESLRLRAMTCEATLAAIRANAHRGDTGLATYVLDLTDGLDLPERHTGPESVPAWVCRCALLTDPDYAGDVPCSPDWCGA